MPEWWQNLGCVSAAVSEAGDIRRVRMARRGRCSCEMRPRQRLTGDPCEKVLPVPEPSPGSLRASNKTWGSTALWCHPDAVKA